MIGTIVNMFRIKELRQRLLFTLGLLAVYRVGYFIYTPGVDPEAIKRGGLFDQGGLLNVLDMFTGGNLGNVTLFALSVMPYISASIIMQLMASVVPSLEKLQREGEAGRRKINQYTRYGTILVCIIQALMLGKSLLAAKFNLIQNPYLFLFIVTVSLTAGTTFVMWLGEQITSRGIGNGISLIITAGIVSRLPIAMTILYKQYFSTSDESRPFFHVIVLLVLFVAVVAGVILVLQGQRRIPVQYAKRVASGGRVLGGQSTYIPLRVNQAGVIPIIFAQSILVIPGAISGYLPASWDVVRGFLDGFSRGNVSYMLLYAIAIVLFCFFYTAITFNPVQIADDFKKNGAFIPGIRPGKPTADFLEHTMIRITVAGSLFLAVIAVVPTIVQQYFTIDWRISSFFGGTGILIVVGVMLDTMQQVEAHLLMRQYDGFMKHGRLRGRY